MLRMNQEHSFNTVVSRHRVSTAPRPITVTITPLYLHKTWVVLPWHMLYKLTALTQTHTIRIGK